MRFRASPEECSRYLDLSCQWGRRSYAETQPLVSSGGIAWTSNAVLGLIIGLMLLMLARDEVQVLNSLAGGGENAMCVNSSPEALLLQRSR